MVKKILSALIVSGSFLLFGVASDSFAAENDESVILDKEDAIYDTESGSYIIPLKKVDGVLIPKTDEEIQQDLEENEKTEDIDYKPFNPSISINPSRNNSTITPLDTYYTYYKYSPSSTSTVSLASKSVSATLSCPSAGVSCSLSKTVSTTVSASYSANVTSDVMKTAIKANAGFTWVNSASDTTTYSFTIKPGQSGRIYFTPLAKKTVGSLKKYSNQDGYLSGQTVTGYSPKKTGSGEADGDYYFSYN